MGISGEADKLLDVDAVKREGIPVIKRFSGGGTVIVDENTLFVTFIMNKSALPIHPFPEPILRWSADLYTEAWQLPNFKLQENDYALGHLKCGGNAQYIQKDRWMHHTSFLYDYSPKNMEYLLLPKRRPAYRQDRSHTDFLCCLKDYLSKEELIKRLKTQLVKQFDIESLSQKELTPTLKSPHRKASSYL